MASKHRRGDLNYACPSAEIAVMGAKGAVEIIFRKDIGDPEKIAARTAEYEAQFANPFVAASKGFIDEVIMPHSTRRRIALGLRKLRDKQLENPWRSEEHTSELQSLMRNSYAVFCLKKQKTKNNTTISHNE